MAGCTGTQLTVMTFTLGHISQNCHLFRYSAPIIKALHEAVTQDSYEMTTVVLSHDGIAFGAATIAQVFDSACELDSQPMVLSLIENIQDKAIGPQNYQEGLEIAARKNRGNVLDFLLRMLKFKSIRRTFQPTECSESWLKHLILQ